MTAGVPRWEVPLRALILAALLALAAGCTAGSSVEPPRDPQAGVSSLELIARAAERGEIDSDTATLYRVFAVVGDERLPRRYRGDAPIRDGTSVLRDARSRFDELGAEVQAELEPYLFPRGQ